MAWLKSNEIYTHDSYAGPSVIFSGSGTSGPLHYPPGQWNTVDLKPLGVSADATFAEIAGHLIITDVDANINNLTATFRRPGSTFSEGNYQMQAITIWNGDGIRGNQMTTVPLVDGCFEFFWQKTQAGLIDVSGASSYLLNLWLQKWGRWQEPAGTPPPSGVPPMVITVPPGGCTVQLVQGL